MASPKSVCQGLCNASFWIVIHSQARVLHTGCIGGAHIFFHCLAGKAGDPPPGWVAHYVRVSHVRIGGSTDAVWHIHHYDSPHVTMVPPQPLTREPWTPLFARIDPMVETEPCPPPCGIGVSAPMVMTHFRTPGVILTEGLFPHNRRSHRVLAKSTWSPAGFGIWPLAPQQLWNLWDVHILLQDVADQEATFAGSLSAPMRSAPAKIALSGAKYLLSGVLRGVTLATSASVIRRWENRLSQ